MKPEKIDWVTVKAFGPYPDEGRELLLSTQTEFLYGDTRPKATEGFYRRFGDPYGFINREGKGIVGVYAWAYKPDCMLGKNKEPESSTFKANVPDQLSEHGERMMRKYSTQMNVSESSPLPSKVENKTADDWADWLSNRLVIDSYERSYIIFALKEFAASQFKSPDSPLNPSSVSKEEESGWPAIQKFMADEISYLKSCNPEDRFGEIENKFAAGMICAYERVQREHEDLLRKDQKAL